MVSYASLSEIWPGMIFNDKFKKFASTLPKNVVNNLIETSENRGGNKYNKLEATAVEPVFYEKSRYYPIDNDKNEGGLPIEKFTNSYNGKYKTECSSILTHLSHCEKCRNFVQQKFCSSQQEEEYNEDASDEYLDLAIYIVTGIFILFMIDILVKFGPRR